MFAVKSTLGSGYTGAVPSVDPYWSNVVTLLNGNGTANASQNNTFTFTAGGSGSITRTGAPTIGTFAPYTTSGWASMAFNGGNSTSNLDCITMPSFSSYAIGASTDFTVEAWIYVNQFSNTFFPIWQSDASLTAPGSTSMWFGATPTGIQIGAVGGSTASFTGQTVNTGTWYHVAVSRQSGTTRAFLNGNLISSSATFSGVAFAQNGAAMGYRASPSASFAFGNISNFRLVNGTAVYTASFTPSTSPLTNITNTAILLTNTNAGVIDYSKKSDYVTAGSMQISTGTVKYGSGSLSFPSTGSWLTTLSTQTSAVYSPIPTVGNILTGDFTIEGWFNFTSGQTSGVRSLIAQWDQSSLSLVGFILRTNAGGLEFLWGPDPGAGIIMSGGSITAGTWQHIAVTRSGNTFRMFLNGTQTATTTNTNTRAAIAVPYSMGNYYGPSRTLPASGPVDFIGFMDEIRITKGYARYTANFTVPAGAFPTS